MTTNPVQKVTQESDIKKIEKIMQGLMGEVCWKAHLGYGDELRLEIGARTPYSQPSMANKEKGAWMLGTRGSEWVLISSGETLVSSSDTPELIKQRVSSIVNVNITGFKVGYPQLDLSITFSNGLKLYIIPNDDPLLAQWELFTPSSMFLEVRPGSTWSYIRSDS